MDDTIDAAGSLTRAEVAKALGISVAGVRRREGKSLHPTQGPKGEWVFDPGEVEAERQRLAAEAEPACLPDAGVSSPQGSTAVPTAEETPEHLAEETETLPPKLVQPPATATPAPAEDGAIAAQVFKLLADGKSPVQAVIETKFAPAVVEELYEAWQRLESLDVSSTGARTHIEELAAAIRRLEAQGEAGRQQAITHAADIAGLLARVGAIEGALIRLGLCRMADADSVTEAAPAPEPEA